MSQIQKLSVQEAQDRMEELPARLAPDETVEEAYKTLLWDWAVSSGNKPRRNIHAALLLEILVKEAEDQKAEHPQDLKGVGKEAYCRLKKVQDETQFRASPSYPLKKFVYEMGILITGLMGSDYLIEKAMKGSESGVDFKGLVRHVDLSSAFSNRLQARRETQAPGDSVDIHYRGPSR